MTKFSPLPFLYPLLSAAALTLAAPLPAHQAPVRSIDGSGNNAANPDWGQAGSELLRSAPSDYADGTSAPSGASRAGAREISNAVCSQSGPLPTAAPVTDMIWQWGQFVDHDIDLTGAADPAEPFDIPVPFGDPFFDPFQTGVEVILFDRSLYAPGSDPRQQRNEITAWLDGSAVYGSDLLRALALRTLDGTGELRCHNGDFLPFNDLGLPNAPDPADTTMFLAGDVRANEQVGLTALHTLFMREHNTIARALRRRDPSMGGRRIYEMARAIVAAEIQRITYEEWLPVLLGPDPLPPYAGYDPDVNPSIANEFSTACYRFGHSMLSPTIQRLAADGSDIPAGPLALREAFFNPSAILDEGGIEPILRGLATQRPQAVDPLVVDDVRNFLFGPPGSGGFDLAALNIQRGRDHGLPGYNAVRVAYGLAPKASFAEITSDVALQDALASVYANPDEVDAWAGGLAEDPRPDALVGELVRVVLADQFRRLRDGDAFWWEHYLHGDAENFVKRQTLAKVIRRNTDIGDELQAKVFMLPVAP